MKRIAVSLVCCLLMIFCISSLVHADDGIVEVPDIKVVIDGKVTTYTDVPIAANGRTLLPLRAVLTELGVQNDDQHIVWNNDEKSVTIYKNSTKIYLKLGSNTVYVNDTPITLDVAPVGYSKNGRIYIPARFVAQSLGKKVAWEGTTKSVLIKEESQFNEVKDILNKAQTAMGSLTRYKATRNINVSVFDDKYKASNETNSALLTDIKNKIYSASIKTLSKIGTVNTEHSADIWCKDKMMYIKTDKDAQWKSIEIQDEQSARIYNAYYFLKSNDTLCSGLTVDSSSSNDEIILKGNINLDELSRQGFDNANIKNYTLSDALVQVSIDKKTYRIDKVVTNIKGSTEIAEQNIKFGIDIDIVNSDFDANFEVPVPKEIELQLSSSAQMEEYKNGLSFMDSGKYEDAIKSFDKVIQADAKFSLAYAKKGIALYMLKEYDDAKTNFDKSLELNPQDADTNVWKAKVYMRKEEYDKSIEYCDKAITINPTSAFAYGTKGWAYNRKEKYVDAITYLDKAIALDSKYLDAYSGKVWALYYQKEYSKSIEVADQALALQPKDEEVAWFKADCYAALLQQDKAITQYKRVLDINPGNVGVVASIGWEYYELQDYSSAMDYADKALKIDPDNKSAQSLKKYVEDARLPDAQRIVNFVKKNYLYYDKIEDFDAKASQFISKGDVTTGDVRNYINSIKMKDDLFTFVVSDSDYDDMQIQENSNQISSKKLDDNTYYVKINSFNASAGNDFKDVISKIENPENKVLVIDVRDNRGGMTDAANQMLDLLLPECMTSYIINRNGYIQSFYSDENQVKFKRVIVLVNESSASSSEILTLGLKKYLNNVVVIGKPTVGKGVGQITFESKNKKYTIFLVSFYWNVREQNINGNRIYPDIMVTGTQESAYMDEVGKEAAK